MGYRDDYACDGDGPQPRRKRRTSTCCARDECDDGCPSPQPRRKRPTTSICAPCKCPSAKSVKNYDPKPCASVESIVCDIAKKGSEVIKKNTSALKKMRCHWCCGEYWSLLTDLMPYLLFLLFLGLLWYHRCFILTILGPLRKVFGYIAPNCWFKSTEQRIEEAIERYHADQIGMADYALESTGGSVLCSSDTYYSKAGPLYSLFGIPIWYSASSPREVIKPEVHPGRCWAMNSDHGFITVQLRMPVVPKMVTLEHIPKAVAPRESDQNAALRDFQITGMEHDLSSPEVMLGNFTFRKNGKPLQQFILRDSVCAVSRFAGPWCGPNKQTFRIVTLRVFNNHGNDNFTCIYRFRVHDLLPDGDGCQ